MVDSLNEVHIERSLLLTMTSGSANRVIYDQDDFINEDDDDTEEIIVESSTVAKSLLEGVQDGETVQAC